MAGRDNPDILSASTMKGDKVINKAGEDLGNIEEIMVDIEDGRVGYAVLSFGGFLGLGDKLFAIPWKALQLKVHDHAFTLDISKETLENAEGFDKDNWPIASREWLSTIYGYYGYQPYWQTGMSGQARTGEGAGPEGTVRTERPAGRENPDFLSADTLKGDKVVNRDGDDIGKLDELMIDIETGNIAYAVVSHGGILGIGKDLFAVPWQALQLRIHEHNFVLDVPKETFDKEKGFDKNNWPITREELSRTYKHYGYQPYWQGAGMVEETESERIARLEREKGGPVESEEERKARLERERLEGLKEEQEEKVSRLEEERGEKEKQEETERQRLERLEKERAEAERQAEVERDKLERLEKERAEAEKQSEVERDKLERLERELQEAKKKEETEKVIRLEAEVKEAKVQAETGRERLERVERERTEAEKRHETEKDRLARLERERKEAETREETEKERLERLEKERAEAERRHETEQERLERLEKERAEAERRHETEKERLERLERERTEEEAEKRKEKEPIIGAGAAGVGQTESRVGEEYRAGEERRAGEESRVGEERREYPDFLSASTIKGDKVINTSGEDLGNIEELMIDLQEGRIGYTVLSFGGIMGLGDKLFAIPWKALQLKEHDHSFVLDVPKETLENAEGFDKDNWPLTTREELFSTYDYYGYEPYWQRGTTEQQARPTGEERTVRTGEAEGREGRESPEFLSAGTIKGDKVINTSGEDLGNIEELMIDLQEGRVGYAVLSFGGILGVSDKLFAIPWQALKPRVHEHAFVLDIPKETLENAEGFDKSDWPLTRSELSKPFGYYGFKPYWREGAVERTEETEAERTARMRTEGERKHEQVETAEERMARQDKEKIEKQEESVSDKEKKEDLEKERKRAEKREEKYQVYSK